MSNTPLPEDTPVLDADHLLGGIRQLLLPDSTSDPETVLTRLKWSLMTEPGDWDAGVLIQKYGIKAAFQEAQSAIQSSLVQRELQQAVAEHAGSAAAASRLRLALKRWRTRQDSHNLHAELTRVIKTGLEHGMRIVTPECAQWPGQLQDLGETTPLILWLKGDARLLKHSAIAVVGARASSTYGEVVTNHFALQLTQAGYLIISGAAYGIDAVAHRAALQAGSPTIAVLAGGLDRPYPQGHKKLLQRIVAAGGLLCSEMPPGAAPTKWRFLQRNRIIAALSEGCLVTEASARSGSINTAGHAAEFGRTLAAVPANVTAVTSQGCHKLLKEYRAELVYDNNSLKEAFDKPKLPFAAAQAAVVPAATGAQTEQAERESGCHTRVLDALPLRGFSTVEKVASRAGLAISECQQALAELELLGKVLCDTGASWPRWQLRR